MLLTTVAIAAGVECSSSERPQALLLAGTAVGVACRRAGERLAGGRYAREALIPEEEFLPVAGDPPAELAARFNVPLEQVDARLIDLAAGIIDA